MNFLYETGKNYVENMIKCRNKPLIKDIQLHTKESAIKYKIHSINNSVGCDVVIPFEIKRDIENYINKVYDNGKILNIEVTYDRIEFFLEDMSFYMHISNDSLYTPYINLNVKDDKSFEFFVKKLGVDKIIQQILSGCPNEYGILQKNKFEILDSINKKLIEIFKEIK